MADSSVTGQRSGSQLKNCAILWGFALVAAVYAARREVPTASDIQLAYIGPGAGIALFGSFVAVLSATLTAIFAILTWPIRRLWRALRGRKAAANALVKRVVIVGLDGLEPALTRQYLDEGLLPNLAKLKANGTYTELATTCPPLSPVAWSSFTTGTNPGKHNIFDFIDRNPTDYRPRISSVRIEQPRRSVRIGRYVIPLSRPTITPLRKSKPFWNVLGEAGIFSAVLRVPISFPPDEFYGVQLSAMCVPDLRGTQGMFAYYTESDEPGAIPDGDIGGERHRVTREGNQIRGELVGPTNALRKDRPEIRVPFSVTHSVKDKVVLRIGGQKIPLPLRAYSEWVRVRFPAAAGLKINGVCRFLLKRFDPSFEMYCTPVQIDPDKPVMPISQPRTYSTYLAKLLGTYATLGLAEDTWSLSEKVIDEDAFLVQAYNIHEERQRMLLDALQRVKRGMVTCVFDAPDRIQHMFWRFIDRDHPALQNQPNSHPNAIRDMYCRMDATVGAVMDQLNDDTALIVLSDHGFKPFRRNVDLNAWLLANGYFKLRDDAVESDRQYLADVDWSRTKAYAIGLAGIYINRQGREAAGIVVDGSEADGLIAELTEKLTGLQDPETEETAIREAIPRHKAYSGPYVDAAPDIIIGYDVGYRVAWDAAVGKCGATVFSPNTNAWSGDHCVHPDVVPGVIFSNRQLNGDGASIMDLAPTTLELLGVAKPAYMDGKSLL